MGPSIVGFEFEMFGSRFDLVFGVGFVAWLFAFEFSRFFVVLCRFL